MRMFNFTQEDLDANHDNYLSKRQRTILRQRRVFYGVTKWITTIGGAIALILLLWNLSQQLKSITAFYAVVVVAWLAYKAIPSTWTGYGLSREDLHKGDIVFVEGEFGLDERQERHYWMRGQPTYYIYTMRIGRVDFPKYTDRNFLREGFLKGQIYRVYYLPSSKTVISAEWIDPNKVTEEQGA